MRPRGFLYSLHLIGADAFIDPSGGQGPPGSLPCVRGGAERSEAERLSTIDGLDPLSLRKAQTAPLDAIKGSLWADRIVGPCIVRLFQAFF